MPGQKATDTDRDTRLPGLGDTGWKAVPDRDAIRKILKFKSFSEAWAFMSRIALLSEKLNHHPEWSNVYNVVDITLTTHDFQGLSNLDLDMAEKIDTLAKSAEVQRNHSDPIECLCVLRHAAKS